MIPATTLKPGLKVFYLRGYNKDSIAHEAHVLEVKDKTAKIRVKIGNIWHDKTVVRNNLFKR